MTKYIDRPDYWKTHDPDFLKYANKTKFNPKIKEFNVKQENHMLFMILKDSPMNSVFVDLGAFKGDSVLDIALQLKNSNRQDVKLIAIEPNAKHCELIRKESNKNHLDVIVIEKAVSDVKGFVGVSGGEDSGVMYKHQDNGNIECDTLDNVLKDYNEIYLLKIDTEGHEDKVLKGAVEVLKNITYLYIEMWNDKHFTHRSGESYAYNKLICSYLSEFYAIQKIEKNVFFERIK
jgi:FkbM family methyltransferase